MGLTTKREEQLKRMPRIETQIEKIPGKNLIRHKTVITDVKPVQYYNAVIQNTKEEIVD
ncbi:MAG: hypothetical protein ABII01_05265 [Candidatus Woesearchaeota archaeon]